MTAAVEAFSRTFLSHGRQRTIVGGKKACNNLPVELLLIIFRLLYGDILPRSHWQLLELEEDFTSASMFPYAIASVCALWRDTMSLDPRFWQRVIIFIDDPAMSFSTLASQFSWSRDRPLDIVVARKKFHDHVDRQYESSQIAMIMKILNSHIHRIRELHFNVMFSSSLPSFPHGFHGTATLLTSLRLQCKEDDGVPKFAESESVAGTENDFHCPQLRNAALDGRNYYEACGRDTGWALADTIAGVVSLSISCFKPRPGESFTVHELLSPLSTEAGPEVLHIRDLVLSPSPANIQPLQPISDVIYLHFFECHDHRIANEIFRAVGSYDLSFTRCSLGGDVGSSRHVGCLELTEINHELVSVLRFWSGSFLTLIDCPHVDDILLDAMATEENGVFACAPYVRTLSILDCPNFSVAALRRLVESRLHLPSLAQLPNHWDFTPTRFERVDVSGDAPRFSRQDVAWFRENVNLFLCRENYET